MRIPEHPDVQNIVWDFMHMDDRVTRAKVKVYLKDQKDPASDIRDLSNKAFDFYGGYARIGEGQKKKYIETQVTLYYKDLINELMQ
jgi:hypothetical protein